MKKYRLYVEGAGSEVVVGRIPDRIWDLIQDDYDGDFDEYWNDLQNGNVDFDYQIVSPGSEIIDIDDVEHMEVAQSVTFNLFDEDVNCVEIYVDTGDNPEEDVETIEEEPEKIDVDSHFLVGDIYETNGIWELDGKKFIELDHIPKKEDVKIIKRNLVFKRGDKKATIERVVYIRIEGNEYEICGTTKCESDSSDIEIF